MGSEMCIRDSTRFSSVEGKFRSARKSLVRDGAKALLPSAHAKYRFDPVNPPPPNVDPLQLPISDRVWHPPRISKRKAAVLRKQAQREGTFGSFDPVTGQGWDPAWDLEVAMANPKGLGRYMRLRVPKKAKRHRTREERAQKIEEKLVGMDERMEELHAARHRSKPPPSFELTYRTLVKRSMK